MHLRDLFVTLMVLGSLPVILYRPYVGVLMWSWIGYMNPHRLSWGFARDFPFAMIIALVTLVALVISKEQKRIPWTRETVVLILFILWMVITTIYAFHPQFAWLQLEKVVKIQVMTFVTLMLMFNRERIELLVWVIALSLGFYGVKGGIFTITNGGVYHVMGPHGTFIGGNNEIGLALIMTIPLLRYLQLRVDKVWIRYGFTAAIVLNVVAILGTQSRGALVGIVTMGLFLIRKSRKRFMLLFLAAIMIPLAYSLMPEQWFERMHTIQTYEQDTSAQGRLAAWRYATSVALHNPLGGGFEMFIGRTDAHSIYFEVLGEHGFVGLTLFLLLGLFAYQSGNWVIRNTKKREDLRWAHDLAAMLQVSLVGYAAAGAFLGLAYFDFYYHLIALIVLCKVVVARELAAPATQSAKASAGHEPNFAHYWFERDPSGHPNRK